MKNDFDAINDSLDIEATPTEIVSTPDTSLRKTPKKGDKEETDYDYDYTRGGSTV